jgi:hypothetical protein
MKRLASISLIALAAALAAAACNDSVLFDRDPGDAGSDTDTDADTDADADADSDTDTDADTDTDSVAGLDCPGLVDDLCADATPVETLTVMVSNEDLEVSQFVDLQGFALLASIATPGKDDAETTAIFVADPSQIE